jgi:hypothetical protein
MASEDEEEEVVSDTFYYNELFALGRGNLTGIPSTVNLGALLTEVE